MFFAQREGLFNTLLKFPGPPGIANRDDLQRLQLDGTLTELAPGATLEMIKEKNNPVSAQLTICKEFRQSERAYKLGSRPLRYFFVDISIT